MFGEVEYSRLLKIKHSEAANISHTVNVHGELPEEIDDAVAALGQREVQDKGCEKDAKDLFNEDCQLHRIQLHKLPFDLIAVNDNNSQGTEVLTSSECNLSFQ